MGGNAYFNGAKPGTADSSFVIETAHDPQIKLIEEGKHVYLSLDLKVALAKGKTPIIKSDLLGKAKIPKIAYENPDGTPFVFDTDYLGNKRTGERNNEGPILIPNSSTTTWEVW